MGEKTVKGRFEGAERREFMRALLNDLHALERMLAAEAIESGVRRIGAEQELFLVDRNWRPSPVAMDLLERLDDDAFTTELALFNLELNLDPLQFGGDCLGRMEDQLNAKLDRLREVAAECGTEIVLCGILPTLRKSDLGLDNMTPMPRYAALNEAMSAMRGGAYEFHIRGLDELIVKHDSVMLEACNASFQVHFQVGAAEFANLYNIAQAVAGPVMAATVNSPLLFGRQLWRETRIALFQQAVDTRSALHYLRERSPRVTFGRSWIRESVLELFQEDIVRFRALVTRRVEQDSVSVLEAGGVPALPALCLHNGTVYRWNRACYGVTDGRPHLRIENRILPAGPSITDQVANAAFWFGLIGGLSRRFDDITSVMGFEDAELNFTSASRNGLEAQLTWLHGERLTAATLIRERLLPLARDGLEQAGIESAHIERYLDVIERRVANHRTGADWMLQSLGQMGRDKPLGERMNALTAAMVARQRTGEAVSEWDLARLDEAGGWKQNFLKVEQYMTTELFTVHEDESLDLVAYLMEWERVRHVPVEDNEARLVGLVSYRSVLRLVARGMGDAQTRTLMVSDVMKRDPISISPDDSTLLAIQLMRENQIGCLPVVKGERLVGVITERDLMNVAAELLEEQLKDAH